MVLTTTSAAAVEGERSGVAEILAVDLAPIAGMRELSLVHFFE